MEEEMIRLQNIMPLELAIKREMEYRSRMEVLKNQRFLNLNPLLPSQMISRSDLVPPPSQTLKRKEPSSSGTARARRSTGLVCKICHMTFGNVVHLNQHSETARHKNNVMQLKKRGQNVSTPFLCELCNSSCSSGLVMEGHLNGTKHATILLEFLNTKRARGE